MSKVSAPPRIDAMIKYSNRSPKPSHSAIAAQSLASPPPIQRHAKKTNAAARTAMPAARCETRTAPLKPPSTATTANPATRTSEMRLAIVMVKRSLAAANAIVAGNSVSPIASLNMTQHRRQNEKAPRRSRSPVQTLSRDRPLFERAGKAAKRGLEVVTETLNHGNNRDRYARGDQTVFDGGRARLVFGKTRDKRFHRLGSLNCHWLFASRQRFTN